MKPLNDDAVRVAWGLDTYEAPVAAAEGLSDTPRSGPRAVSSDDRSQAIRVADSLLSLDFTTWNFGDSVAFEAMLAATSTLADERWARFAQGWGRAWVTRSQPFVRLDCTIPGSALVKLAQRYDDRRLLDGCLALAEYLTSRPMLGGVFETWEKSPLLRPYGVTDISEKDASLLANPPSGVFVDCMHFDPPFLCALGAATGREDLTRLGVQQALGYVRLLQRPNGLFDHFVLREQPGSFGSGWGRGQGWAILGLLEVIGTLDDLGSAAPPGAREPLTRSARRLLEAMVRLQRGDGHWSAVVTAPDSGDEFSTAAFMAAAIDLALRAGIVAGEEMMKAQSAARGAVIDSFDKDANLRNVSAAVYASTVEAHYRNVPTGYVVPWGQGPALLAMLSGRDS